MGFDPQTGRDVRLAARSGALAVPTVGLASSYLQANLIVLPERYAADFRLLCARNPVPCPLLAESAAPGSFDRLVSHVRGVVAPNNNSSSTTTTTTTTLPVAADIDLRHDAPRYRVYQDGQLVSHPGGGEAEPADVAALWQADHVGFLVGCSFSFEGALAAAGLAPLHASQGRNVPMYRTALPLCAAGVFAGGCCLVVSMRAYRPADVERVRDATRPYVATHGEPVAWGWEARARLGIRDVAWPDWGDPPLGLDGATPLDGADEDLVPVFWGCGVTPQEAVMRAGLKGTVLGHAPGHMIVLDIQDHEVFPSVVEKPQSTQLVV